MPISFQADGSLDRGLRDTQAMMLSIIGKYGLKETYVLDPREHDKEQRRGGRLMPMQRHTVMPRRLTSKTITSGSFS